MTKENNKCIPMNKSTFIKTINAIKEYHKKINNIQEVLKENCEDSMFFPPSLESTLIDVLSNAFNDYTGMIDYYIYELNFGEEWKPGCITEHDRDVKMQTPEELYDYLIEGL